MRLIDTLNRRQIWEAMVQDGFEPIFESKDIKYGRVTKDNFPHYPMKFKKANQLVWKSYSAFDSTWMWVIGTLENDTYTDIKLFNL